MPQLQVNNTALGMDRLGDLLPSIGVSLLLDLGCTHPTPSEFTDLCAFRDDKTSTGSLGVIFGHNVVGQAVLGAVEIVGRRVATGPCHWRHDEAVLQLLPSQGEFGGKVFHLAGTDWC